MLKNVTDNKAYAIDPFTENTLWFPARLHGLNLLIVQFN